MFKNYDSDVVGFNSSWKTEKNSTDGESQTTEFSTKDSGTSAKVSQSIAVQTEAPEVTVSERPSTPPGLASWLEGIAPMVMKELRLNQRDSIFRNYNPNCDNTAPDPKARLLQTVRAEAPEADTSVSGDSLQNSGGGGETDKIKFPVSALSWSCAGSTLAVAQGKLSHDDWCQHEGNIYIYIKSGQTQELKHNAELKMGSCCSAVTFHPSEPALLATASVSGEVCAWNLQRLGEGAPPLLGAPGASPNQAHGARRVSALLWLRDSQRDRFLEGTASNNQILVSCGSDGKVVIWLVNFAASTFVEHRCYEVNTQVGKSMSLPDLSCIDFRKVWSSAVEAIKSDQAEDVFVVGCKTGELFACRVNNATPIAASTHVSPLVFPLEPHGSAVLRVSFTSKAPGFTLLTLGADLEIRTYSLPQTSPLQVLYLDYAVSSVDWLPGSNSLVLAVVGEALRNSAMLQVFDVINGIEVNVDGLDPSGSDSSSEPCGFTSLALNSKSVNTVACGNMVGDVSIWNIPFNNISSSSANRN